MNGSGTARALSRLWLLAIAIIAITVLYLAKVLFLPLAFAILFAFLLAPLVASLERVRLPRTLAVIIVMVGFLAVLGSLGWVLFSQLIDVANALPTYRDNIAQKLNAIHSPSNSAFSRALAEVERLSDQLESAASTSSPLSPPIDGSESKKALGASPAHPVQVREVSHSSWRLEQLGGVFDPLAIALLTIVFTFFVLLQREDLRNRLIRLSGDRNLTVITQAMKDASRRISRYFALQLLVNVTYGAVIVTALHFIGLPHPLVFGGLAALCRFIPYIGWPFAAFVPTVLSLAVFHGWTKSLLIAGIFFCVEIVTANYAEPHIYGRHTGLSSLAILVAAAFWTLLWGPVGLILSVPLTVCLVVMGRHVRSLEFLTVMLGDRPKIPTWICFYQRLLARDEQEAAEILETSAKDKTLAEVYDALLVPALAMSEEDRLHRDLDESAIGFIRTTIREMIEELGFTDGQEEDNHFLPALSNQAESDSIKVMCVPVHDETDELTALMLAQALNSRGIHALASPSGPVDKIVGSVVEEKPQAVVVSGLPPVGFARLNRLYRTLRARNPGIRIAIGIWNDSPSAIETAQKLAGGQEIRTVTTLTQAVAEVCLMLGLQESALAAADQSSPITAAEHESAA
jgi:predicted PurR-regulated permease PerM